MIDFLDSSVLVKRYVREPGSDAVRRVSARGARVAVARVAFAEVAATLARAAREGTFETSARDRALDRLADDIARWDVVEARPRVIFRVRELVCRHPLRGYDAVQLASGLELRGAGAAVRFWCTDRALADAAAQEGFSVVRPV